MLRLSYGSPLKVRLRLNKPENPIEEDVYLGEIPLMIGGGAFIVNGAERVLVNQLHRSPGIDFMEERVGDKKMHSCWIVPERGSWIEISVTKRDSVAIRIDQGGKIPATTFLRACSPEFSTNEDIIRVFYETQEVKLAGAEEAPVRDDGIWHEVRSLPGKQRSAVTLRYLADLSHAEIAEVMGTSEAAARRNVFEGLKRLRERVEPTTEGSA